MMIAKLDLRTVGAEKETNKKFELQYLTCSTGNEWNNSSYLSVEQVPDVSTIVELNVDPSFFDSTWTHYLLQATDGTQRIYRQKEVKQ